MLAMMGHGDSEPLLLRPDSMFSAVSYWYYVCMYVCIYIHTHNNNNNHTSTNNNNNCKYDSDCNSSNNTTNNDNKHPDRGFFAGSDVTLQSPLSYPVKVWRQGALACKAMPYEQGMYM